MVLSRTMARRNVLAFDVLDVNTDRAELHHKFVVVPADKASTNIVFICKTNCIHCLMEVLGKRGVHLMLSLGFYRAHYLSHSLFVYFNPSKYSPLTETHFSSIEIHSIKAEK